MPDTTIDYRALLLARIEGDDRPTRRAELCLSPKAADALLVARTNLLEAERANPPREDGQRKARVAGDPVTEARQTKEAAAQAVRDASVAVVLQALPEAEYRAFMAEATARPQGEREKTDAEIVLKCLLRVETLDGAETNITRGHLAELLPKLSAGEIGFLASTAISVNQEGVEVPSSALR